MIWYKLPKVCNIIMYNIILYNIIILSSIILSYIVQNLPLTTTHSSPCRTMAELRQSQTASNKTKSGVCGDNHSWTMALILWLPVPLWSSLNRKMIRKLLNIMYIRNNWKRVVGGGGVKTRTLLVSLVILIILQAWDLVQLNVICVGTQQSPHSSCNTESWVLSCNYYVKSLLML